MPFNPADPLEYVIGENGRRESKRSYAAFRDYCAMGTARGLRPLAERYRSDPTAPTRSLSTLAAWSANFWWADRSRAFDALQQAKALAEYEERWRAKIMGANEILGRFSDEGRASIADFITVKFVPATVGLVRSKNKPVGDEDEDGDDSDLELQVGEMVQVVELNWEAIRANGHLIKSITNTKYGPRIELYDGQTARIQLGRHHGLFTDNQKVSGTVEHEHKSDPKDHERFDNTISAFAEALREILPGAGPEADRPVGPEQ